MADRPGGVGRAPTVGLLLCAAGLDVARSGLGLATAVGWLPVLGLVGAGVDVAVARGFRHRRPWASWAALAVGAGSLPQAILFGFRHGYLIPDVLTALIGVVLTAVVAADLSALRGAAGLRTGPEGGFVCLVHSGPCRVPAASSSAQRP